MNLFDEEIAKALTVDSLTEAEKLTGLSYKEDPLARFIGLLGHIQHCKDVDALLTLNQDTTFSNKVDRYLEITTQFGFQIALKEEFVAEYFGDQIQERYYILYHPDGILLAFDTYGGNSVNSSNFYYNWKPHSWGSYTKGKNVLSSGSWGGEEDKYNEYIWAGYHDGREALKHHINALKEEGDFINPWKYNPHMTLNHSAEWKQYELLGHHEFKKWSGKILEERYSKLPEEVRKMIGVKDYIDKN